MKATDACQGGTAGGKSQKARIYIDDQIKIAISELVDNL